MINISPEKCKNLKGFTFIDLFAGIGGFRFALESFKCKCVFSSEWDKNSQKTYFDNFKELPDGDITKILEENIPSHDIIAGGFPCQAFSISGKMQGFDDIRGTLFFDIVRIANHHKPKVLLLENVKNLAIHNNGATLKTILETLDKIGYTVFYKILIASQYGLPQSRERIYFVCFRKDLGISNFEFPSPTGKNINLLDILEDESLVNPTCYIERSDINIYGSKLLSPNLFPGSMNRPIQIGKMNKGGQGERIYSPLGHAITLSAYGGGPGGKTGAYLINDKVRKLTPRECARVQGFPEKFILNPSKSISYTQFGNSVPVNVLQHILLNINKALQK
jgi:DNA (cytosine-5)-methyltransferase 1